MIKIKICEKHQIEKIYYEKHKKYECRQCRKDYIKEYRERNKEKIKAVTKTYNISKREKRQEWVKEDRIKNPEKYKAYGRKGQIKNAQERAIKKCVKKYGLTVEQYKKMILDCDNKCNICGKEETRKLGMDNKLTKLCVDHNHTTKKVRALLCFTCNLGIGKFKDDINLLEKAIQYLKKHDHSEG